MSKITIRKKLIFSYLSLLVVPILIVFSMVFVLSSPLVNKLPILSTVKDLEDTTYEIADLFSENTFLGDFEILDKQIKEKISENHIKRLIFVNTKNIVLYDTDGSDTIGYDIGDLEKLDVDFSQVERNVFYGNSLVGKLLFIPAITIEDTINFLIYIPFVMGGIFLITVLAMIMVLSKIISDGILAPLSELNSAAERISNGDLDFEMNYKEDDELGKLCIEFDRMRLKLKNSLDRQEKYERSRKLLLASISHDLRTPLTSIKGYVEALNDDIITDEETRKRYLNVIEEKSNKLNSLIDDLFVYSKMELGEFSIAPETISADFLLESLLVPKEMEFKDSSIDFILDKNFPVVLINVDDKRISQVVDNVIHNASKYTRNYIKVATDVDNGFLRIFVEDDGFGIPKEELPFIFDQFYKVEKSRNSSNQGSGLGLSIAKKLISAHGGRISVKSEEGKGTIFKIEIPIKKRPKNKEKGGIGKSRF